MSESITVAIRADDSRVAAGMRSAADKVRSGTTNIRQAVDSLKATFDGVGRAMKEGFLEGARAADQAADSIEADTRRMQNSTSGLTTAFGGLKSMLVGLGLAKLATDVVRTTAEFGRLRSILATLEGSEGAGTARFEELKRFASDTPFELSTVIEAFNRLKSQGLDPSNAALASYGNTAAAMGKSLIQMVEAVADASVGEFERLKEFGIKAVDAGDRVIFNFKGQATEVKKNSTDIQNYLQQIGNIDFAGAMERQTNTLGGAFSRVANAAANLADQIGQGGLSDALKGVVGDLVGATSRSGEFAATLGDVLGTVIREVWELVKTLGSVISDTFATIADIIRDVTGSTSSNMKMWQTVINAVKVTFIALGFTFREVAVVIGTAIRSTLIWINAFADAVASVARMDLSGAVAAVANAVNRQREVFAKGAADMARIHTESAARAQAAWNDTGRTAAASAPLAEYTPGAGADFGAGVGRGRRAEAGGADGKAAQAQREAERVAREAERAAREAERWARQQFQTAQQLNELRIEDERRTALAGVAARQDAADLELLLGLVTNQKALQREQEFENERHRINVTALQQRLELLEQDPNMNPVEYARIKSDILQLEQEHQARTRQIRMESFLQSRQLQLQGIQSLSQSWGDTLSQMLVGQQTFAQGVRSLWTGLVGAISQALTQMIAQWLARQLAAFLLGKAAASANAAGQITANAGVAGSAAFASTAAIPIVGPALAPGAAAAAMAGALSFMPMAFAAKGFDIPAGVNPITQLHQKEMVLPAEHAEVIRRMAETGGGGAGHVIHFHAPGTMSRSEMERHASTLVRVLHNAWQNREVNLQ